MSTLAIIPARSGSKRVIDKNIRLVNGKPLIHYSIENALSVHEIATVAVSSDSELYLDIVQEYKSDRVVAIKRPPHISDDLATLEQTILHTLEIVESQDRCFDNIVLIQPTSPLTSPLKIKEGIQLLKNNPSINSVLTYTKFNRFFIDRIDEIIARPRTQDKLHRQMETGCFWVFRINEFKKIKNRVIHPYGLVEVTNTESLDIDTEEDLYLVESVLKNLNRNSSYVSRECSLNDVDTQYSSIRTDPDNVERDHTTECKNKQEFCRKEVEFINECEGGNFLDLGCGNGYLFPIISDKFDKFGLEVSRSYEGTLSQYCDNVYFGELTGDIYPEGFFDVILCHHVIEHVKKPVEFLKNINHVLKRHGNLVIATPDFDSPVARRFGDNFRMLHDKTHISLFSLKSLKNILDENGFHVDNIDLPFFETKYFNKEHLLRLFDTSKMSPAFYGNIITMYCRKK